MVFKSSNSPFNPYQDCYTRTANVKSNPALVTSNSKSYENNEGPFFDQGANQFADSTDAMGGFQCYVDDAMDKYLNLPDVRKALHVEQFTACGAGNDFVETEWDMTAEFAAIIDSGADIRGLIYNGDMDLTSSFLADQWFLEEIAAVKQLKVVAERAEWTYKRGKGFPPVGGGYSKRFGQGKVALDLVQVKGAGLFTSTDRPAPTLQMIRNFIESAKSYDHTQTYTSIDAAPLLKEFLDAPAPELSRKEEDRVFDLPGLTWKLNFDQYAGYLNGIKGNYLHYWFVESQRDPKNDPLVLWLSGGPGCSGYTALLWGNGPFRPNRDQTTLYENIYSWNKIANVIFIDSPRGVGYSFQNFTENPSLEWNDELTAEDLKLALLDFLGVYPEYKNRHFYLTGESYGGVYVPSTAVKLIELIQVLQILFCHLGKNHIRLELCPTLTSKELLSVMEFSATTIASIPDYSTSTSTGRSARRIGTRCSSAARSPTTQETRHTSSRVISPVHTLILTKKGRWCRRIPTASARSVRSTSPAACGAASRLPTTSTRRAMILSISIIDVPSWSNPSTRKDSLIKRD
ncbi:hypothetical protein PRIPAC_77212 [Pristionchus pacificus]|nr:hypothetical protein PRIPAC_77212 [Pristionchus pacificus]